MNVTDVKIVNMLKTNIKDYEDTDFDNEYRNISDTSFPAAGLVLPPWRGRLDQRDHLRGPCGPWVYPHEELPHHQPPPRLRVSSTLYFSHFLKASSNNSLWQTIILPCSTFVRMLL